jgi:competence protein ComEC
VVLTHPHADHLTGLVEVLKRYQVERALYPDSGDQSPLYREWQGLVGEESQATIARAGEEIDLGDGVIIEVLNPPVPPLAGTESDTDNNGVVLRLTDGRVSFLLTADIQREGEIGLLAQQAELGSTVLKIAHHGSKTSTIPEFLAEVSPAAAVISVGENSFGHPSGEVIGRLEQKLGAANIYRTDKQGTIEFITDGERLWVRTGL